MTSRDPFPEVRFAALAFRKLVGDYQFTTVLDVGSGAGEHTRAFLHRGKKVTAVDFAASRYFRKSSGTYAVVKGDYLQVEFDEPFDAVWASHVLEHQPNAHQFMRKLFHDCKEGGVVAITVPPLKHQIVGGHLSLWNPGLLLYNVVFAGYDCSDAAIKQYDYNISLIVRKKAIPELPPLCYDVGDIEALLPYLPEGLNEPFDGDFDQLQWD